MRASVRRSGQLQVVHKLLYVFPLLLFNAIHVLQSARADGDRMRRPPGHLITGAGRDEAMRKGGGEEARSVRCMCDVCAAHGDRAAVGVDVDAKGSGLREDETYFPLNARVECRAFVSGKILVGLRWHAEKAAVFLCFPMSL